MQMPRANGGYRGSQGSNAAKLQSMGPEGNHGPPSKPGESSNPDADNNGDREVRVININDDLRRARGSMFRGDGGFAFGSIFRLPLYRRR